MRNPGRVVENSVLLLLQGVQDLLISEAGVFERGPSLDGVLEGATDLTEALRGHDNP